jgi:hypothetical protein
LPEPLYLVFNVAFPGKLKGENVMKGIFTFVITPLLGASLVFAQAGSTQDNAQGDIAKKGQVIGKKAKKVPLQN